MRLSSDVLVAVVLLAVVASSCSQTKDREYKMRWKVEQKSIKGLNQTNHVHLQFLDERDRWKVIVSDELGNYLIKLGENPVSTTWESDIYLGIFKYPRFLKSVGNLEDFEREFSYDKILD